MPKNISKLDIPEPILRELYKIKDAQAILFTGSRVLGKVSKNSDWDFHVILKKGMPRWRKTWKVQDSWIEIFCNNPEDIRKEFKSDREFGGGITIFMFATGKAIQDSQTKVLAKLQHEAKILWQRGPKPVSAKGLNWYSYDLSSYIQDIEDCLHDNNSALLLFNYALNAFINHYYRVKRLWLPRPKDRVQDLAKRSKKLHNLYKAYNGTLDWRKKAKILVRFGRMVAKECRLSLEGEVYISPSSRK